MCSLCRCRHGSYSVAVKDPDWHFLKPAEKWARVNGTSACYHGLGLRLYVDAISLFEMHLYLLCDLVIIKLSCGLGSRI